jgi:isoleucyl-tRNA synthetase
VRLRAKDDYAAAASHGQVVVLDVRVSDALRREGLAREVVNRIQRARKAMNLAYEARIRIGYVAAGELGQALAENGQTVARETLALELAPRGSGDAAGEKHETDVDGEPLTFWIALA